MYDLESSSAEKDSKRVICKKQPLSQLKFLIP